MILATQNQTSNDVDCITTAADNADTARRRTGSETDGHKIHPARWRDRHRQRLTDGQADKQTQQTDKQTDVRTLVHAYVNRYTHPYMHRHINSNIHTHFLSVVYVKRQ